MRVRSAQQGSGAGSQHYDAGTTVIVAADGENITVRADKNPAALHKYANQALFDRDGSASYEPLVFGLTSSATADSIAKPEQTYKGMLRITAKNGKFVVVLQTDLESYVQGVLQSEIPAYFKGEAMKAQAVLARTYGINPRLSHQEDDFDVCDSYLHCQAFYGVRLLTALQSEAIRATSGEILLYQGKPALALFSACAGGHTENYENCFSDPESNAFPPPPISYLSGVPEGALPQGFPSESAMRALFALAVPQTVDAWSLPAFRWTAKFTADALEAHMHHTLEKMREDPQFKPFIHPPASSQFGHIEKFEVGQRGLAGTAMTLNIFTNKGVWKIEKELTIRSAFENPDLKLKRLKSARVFFDHTKDSLGLLRTVVVHGFGSGHGVGLQQVGAHGLALKGLDYRKIIDHYYKGTEVGRVR